MNPGAAQGSSKLPLLLPLGAFTVKVLQWAVSVLGVHE